MIKAKVQGVVIEHITEHKQSETTQRWKLGLHLRGSGHLAPAKPLQIETPTQSAVAIVEAFASDAAERNL